MKLSGTLLLFVIRCSFQTLVPHQSSNNYSTLLEIFKQFSNYNLFYHFDNVTKMEIDGIIYNRDLTQTYFIANYDLEAPIHRPRVDKVFNIVFFENVFMFQQFSEKPYNLFPFDSVLFIIDSLREYRVKSPKISAQSFWKMPGMRWSSNTIIFELLSQKLFHCCFYCGNLSGILRDITAEEELTKLVNNYRDFNGHVFRVAYADFPPFFWCEEGAGGCRPQGAEAALLEEFSRLLNFRYELVKYEGELSQGQWQAMIEGVHLRRVDWAIGGISVSLRRGNLTDFTRYIKQQGFAVLYASSPQTWMGVENLLLILEWSVWLCLVLSILLIGAFTKLAVALMRVDDGEQGFMKYSRAALMSIVEQGFSHDNYKFFTAHSVKIVFVVWWAMIMCLTTMYKSQLTSSLIKPDVLEPSSIDELVEAGFEFRANKDDWSVLRENLLFSSDKVFDTVLQRIDDRMEFCAAIMSTFSEKVAVIDEEAPIQYDIFKKCWAKIDRGLRVKLRLLPNNIFPNSYHAWSMQTATPFRLLFSSILGYFDDIGLIYHWYNEAFSYRLFRSNEFPAHNSQFVPLSLEQFLPALFTLIVGVFSAVLVLFYEIYHFYYTVIKSTRR